MSEEWDGLCPKCSTDDNQYVDEKHDVTYWHCADCDYDFKTPTLTTYYMPEDAQ